MSLFDMKGKVAVITGSTKGIGRAIAERMAEHGAKVVISSRKADVCDKVAADINGKFGKGTAVAIAANISSKENLQNLVDESNRAFGRIDVLVCNAASNPYYGPLGGLPERGLAFDIDNCSVTRLDHLSSASYTGWRLPMVNQQPWIADAAHAAMHQPSGPEVVQSKLA